MFIKPLIILLCILFLGGAKRFEEVKSLAYKENKKILLNFSGSDWCLPCIKMEKQIFSTQAFMDIIKDKILLFRADFPRNKEKLTKEQYEENKFLAEKYNPGGHFPYTLLLNSDGKIIHIWDGYSFKNNQFFFQELEKYLAF